MEESFPHLNLTHYRIISKLGAGGMGKVYLAEDTRLDRKVALKLLHEDVAAESERLRRFVQEAKAASALNHPNIITIHEIGETENRPFIAIEYIDGETLHQRLRNGPLSLKSVLDAGIQIASALQAAHEANIIHRDIKPENVMVRPDGLIKVLDFGIAKVTEPVPPSHVDAEAETVIVGTSPGMIVGTPAYMSPEQARGKPVDARTDIFSLGVVLYEMLTGRKPSSYTTESAPINSIAVLPFQNKSPDTETEYLSDGLAESLIYGLSQLPNLKVSPTSSVSRFKGKEIDPVLIGNELGVNAVMTGRFAQRGDDLTISVELVDVRYNQLLWGRQYDRKLADLLTTRRNHRRAPVG